ncbi:MAG: hypothetical protein K1X74_00475 [Pirellulales bacterium]|nr:hypothetical protein [Pirellulales bacterium]
MEPNRQSSPEQAARELMDELLELRRAVASALGREQYIHQVLDEAIESQYQPTLIEALSEFDRQPTEIKTRILEAARQRDEW